MTTATTNAANNTNDVERLSLTGAGNTDATQDSKPEAIDSLLWNLSSPQERRQILADQQLRNTVEQHLQPIAADPDAFGVMMAKVYGDSIDPTAVETLRLQILDGTSLSLPRVVLVDAVELQGAQGAYHSETDTIYLDKSLVGTIEGDRTLLEEFGHAIDERVNSTDTQGDEGEHLRRLLTDNSLTDNDLATIKAENDTGTILINGKYLSVEFRHAEGAGVTSDYPWSPGGIIYSGVKNEPDPEPQPAATPTVTTSTTYQAPSTPSTKEVTSDYPWAPNGIIYSGMPERPAAREIPPADERVVHAFTYTQHFEVTFGDNGTIKNGEDRFIEIANGEQEDEIRERLQSEGNRTEEQIDDTYLAIEAAASFYVANPVERSLLDRADDDSNESDNKFSIDDGRARLLDLTQHTDHPDEQAARQQVIHQIGQETALESGWSVNRIEDAYVGRNSVLDTLSSTDQETLLNGFVDGLHQVANRHPDGIVYAPPLHDDSNVAFSADLRAVYADEAIRMQLETPYDPAAQISASGFATSSLQGMTPDQRVEFIHSLDGVVEVEGLPAISEASLFGRSLQVPFTDETFELGNRFYAYNDRWQSLVETEKTLAALNDAAGEGGSFTQAEQEFVSVVFTNMPANGYYITQHNPDNPQDLPATMANSLAIAAYPGDADAQAEQTARMRGVLETSQGQALLTNQPANHVEYRDMVTDGAYIDPTSREYLASTFIHGRVDRNGNVEYWDASDFSENNSRQVVADLAVDTTNLLQENIGNPPLTRAQEQNLRAIVATEQGNDLFGLGERNSHTLRTQFAHIVIDRELTVEDFGEGNGWDNGKINGEYLVLLAQRIQPQTALTSEQQQNLRAIGESDAGRQVIGLEAPISDEGRARFLTFTLENDWTVETYAEHDDPSLNTTFLNAFAGEHADRFRPGGDLFEALDGERQVGPTDEFVKLALGLPHDAQSNEQVDRVIDAINGHRDLHDDGTGSAISVIPITVNTGSEPVDLMLFQVTEGDTTRYIDLNGKHYSSVNDWWNNNGLPSGTVAFTGTSNGSTSNSQFVSPGTDSEAGILTAKTENFKDTWWEHHGSSVITGLAVVGSVAVIVGSLGTATPLVAGSWTAGVGTFGAVTLGGVGAYQLYDGTSELYSHATHGGALDFSDPTARGAYFNLVEGGLTVVTAGASGVAFRGGKLANSLSSNPGLSRAVGFATTADEAYALGINGYSAIQILGSDLPAEEQLKQLAILGIFTGLDVGIPALLSRSSNLNAGFVANTQRIDPDLSTTQISDANTLLYAAGRDATPESAALLAQARAADPDLSTEQIFRAQDAGAGTADEIVAVAQVQRFNVTVTAEQIRSAEQAGATTPVQIAATAEAQSIDPSLSDDDIRRALDSGAETPAQIIRIANSNAATTTRPSWRQSELDVGTRLGSDYQDQISFLNGDEVPYGTKGSVRPDFYTSGESVEVKNYDVESVAGRRRLERNLTAQILQRQTHLPTNTSQKVEIDVRGQNVSMTDLRTVINNIVTNSNGAVTADDFNIIR